MREKPEGIALVDIRDSEAAQKFIPLESTWHLINIETKEDHGNVKVDERVVVASGKQWEVKLLYTQV